MLIKKITYKDFNDVERTEDFYFNMSKAEVIKWMTTNGNYTLDKVVGKLLREENVRNLIDEFDYLIRESYGEISLDGKRFIKSPEVKANFLESNAYSVLFMELVGDAKKAAEFFNGIFPDDLTRNLDDALKNNSDALPDVLKDYLEKNKDILDNDNKVVEMPNANAAAPTT